LGGLVSYSVIQNSSHATNQESKQISIVSKSKGNPIFITFVGLAIGLVIALPPFVADAQWRAALRKGDGAAIIKNATQWPEDSRRLTEIAFALEKSNLPDDAIKIARENVRFNPRSTDAWRLLAQLSKSTPEEKTQGVAMMHKLDPLNTELK
jgi:rRNA maturation protein Rpf1